MSQPENEDESTPDAAFVQLLKAYHEAVRAGRMSEADVTAMNILAMAGQHARDDPSPELLLEMDAHRCEGAADWQGAEVAYRKVLELATATGHAAYQYKAHSDLAGLSHLVGNDAVALEQARSATEAARRAEMPILCAMALEQHAACALLLDRVPEALTAVDEALRFRESERLLRVQRGRGLVLRAECRQRSSDSHGAECDLEAAWQDLEPQSAAAFLAGVHSALAGWWSVKARIHAEQGAWSEAAGAWTKAVAFRRHVAALPHLRGPYTQNALAETLRTFGQALLSAGCPTEAEEPLAESRAIRERIGLPHLV